MRRRMLVSVSGMIGLVLGSCALLDCASDAQSGPFDEARRQAIMDAIDAKFAEAYVADRTNALTTVQTFARGFPEITEVGVPTNGMLMMSFRDNVLYAVLDDGKDDDTGTTVSPLETKSLHPPSDVAAPPKSAPGPWVADSLPLGKQFVLLRAVDGTWPSPEVDIAKRLTALGYTEKKLEFTARALKDNVLQNVGFLWINTHGGQGTLLRPTSVIDTKYAFWTAEPAPPDKKPPDDYVKDLTDRRLAYLTANVTFGKQDNQRRFALTSSFIEYYWTPEPSLVVFANACSSLDGTNSMRTAFTGADGSGAYLGWDKKVNDRLGVHVINTVFDHLLGASFGELVDQPTPPTRPFDVETALEWLDSNGKLRAGDTVLDYYPRRGSHVASRPTYPFAALSPSLVRAEIDVNDPTHLVLVGDFGFPRADLPASAIDTSKIAVTVGGAAAKIVASDWVQSWQRSACKHSVEQGRCLDSVSILLPDDGPGASGDVVVTVNGIVSNALPLTEWRHLKVHAQIGVPTGCTTTFDWDLHLRADIHPFRDTSLLGPGSLQSAQGSFVVGPSSTVAWTVAGSFVDPVTKIVQTCTGSGTATAVTKGAFAVDKPLFHAEGSVLVEAVVQAPPAVHRLKLSVGEVGAVIATVTPATGLARKETVGAAFDDLTLSIDAAGNLQAGTLTSPAGTPYSWSPVSPTGTVPDAKTQL